MIMERKHIAEEFRKNLDKIKEDQDKYNDFASSYGDLLNISERVIEALDTFIDRPKKEAE